MNKGPGNPVALGLVIVGAAAMAIAAFLPLDEPATTLRMVQSNSLIQHGGWVLIALAVGIAASGFRASQHEGTHWQLPLVLCLLAAAQIVYWFMDKDTRTLYPVGPNGTVDSSQPGTVVALGIALYVAAAGVAAALNGTLMLRQQARAPQPTGREARGAVQTRTKKCPDCAETILADAKVCKHCGYRFAPTSTPDAPPEQAPAKTTKVKCHHCQHVQMVPLSQQTFVCEECGTKLKRRTPVEGS